jgi:hypothetical protein
VILGILWLGALLCGASSQINPTQTSTADPIVGEWLWFNNLVIKIEPDGRTAGDAHGTWRFANNKEVERKYVLKWDGAVVVDNLALSRDGKKLTGKNNSGHAVSATRLPEKAQAAPSGISAPTVQPREQRVLKGSFYVSVDDSASIYVNGTKVHHADLNESRSAEMELKTGDRVLVRLRNAVAGHRFMMAFVSSDDAYVVSFRTRDFRIPPDPRLNEFSAEEFASWTKPARQEKQRDILPVKSLSNWVWADRDDGTIAAIVMPDMIGSRIK